MSVFFFYSKEKEKLKTEDYRDFIVGRHLRGFFSCDEGENYLKTVSAMVIFMVLQMRISVNS